MLTVQCALSDLMLFRPVHMRLLRLIRRKNGVEEVLLYWNALDPAHHVLLIIISAYAVAACTDNPTCTECHRPRTSRSPTPAHHDHPSLVHRDHRHPSITITDARPSRSPTPVLRDHRRQSITITDARLSRSPTPVHRDHRRPSFAITDAPAHHDHPSLVYRDHPSLVHRRMHECILMP